MFFITGLETNALMNLQIISKTIYSCISSRKLEKMMAWNIDSKFRRINIQYIQYVD